MHTTYQTQGDVQAQVRAACDLLGDALCELDFVFTSDDDVGVRFGRLRMSIEAAESDAESLLYDLEDQEE